MLEQKQQLDPLPLARELYKIIIAPTFSGPANLVAAPFE